MVKKLEYRCKNAKVYFRCTPNIDTTWDYVKILDDKKTLYVRCLQDFLSGSENAIPNYWCFETDGIFYNDSQRDIYDCIMPDVLRRFLVDGKNAVIVAYGATGTGKSLTISGIDNAYEDRGLISRSIENLLRLREEYKNKLKIAYSVSFIEATNTHVCDLLDEKVPIYNSQSMKHVIKAPITDLQNTLIDIFKGEGRKTNVKRALYNSHASHSILTITATSRLNDETKVFEIVSKLHFVDLAGVDTVGNESCFYKNVIEIGMANVTKTQMEQFVLALIENVTQNIIVKQKLNILIQYLGNAMSHSSQIRLIGHIRTGKKDLMMTLSMLRFSNIVRGLKSKIAETYTKETKEGKINKLEETVNSMRRELEIQSMILNNTLAKNLNQDRINHLQQLAESYLSNKISELVVVSFSDINTILRVFKDRFLDLETKKKEEVEAAYQLAFEKAVESFKGPNRTGSFKKVSPIKSRESLNASQSSKNSKRSLSWKGSKLSADSKDKGKKGKDKQSYARKSPPTSLDQRSSRQGSKIMRKSTKKRSSVVSDTKDEMSETIDELTPSNMPTYEQAWGEFILDEKFEYEKLKIQLTENEKTAKEINVKYLTEIRVLHEMRQNFEAKKEALRLAQMGREIAGVITVDEEGNMKIGDAETEYKNAIKQMESDIVEQQENLLLIQSELRIQLEVCKQTRKCINEQYELFCLERHNTLVPNLKEKYTEVPEDLQLSTEGGDETRDDITKDLSECYNSLVRYESFKNIMQQQKIKMKLRELQNRRWIRSCKP